MPRSSARTTRFAVDAMLGSLSRKLRAFGFDTLYYKEGTDAGILEICRRQGRVLVTADRSLASRAGRLGLLFLPAPGGSDGRRMSAMVRAARQRGLPLKRGEPRCSLCNGGLSRIPVLRARRLVPAAVSKRHRSFYRCSECGQMYWKGGHWKKLRRLEAIFESRP